jgi:hypothetical protein
MGDALPLVLLGVVGVCLIAMTTTMILTTRELRGTLRRFNTTLLRADKSLLETHRAFRQTRRVMATAHRATREVETVIRAGCDAALDAMHQLGVWKRRAKTLFNAHVGNGAGADPRRHRRR